MKVIRELKTLDWSGYIFKEMVNILDIDPKCFMINDFKGCRDGSILFNLCYCGEPAVPHIVFNNIECIFRKSGIYSYLIFCENSKNKNMINNYINIIDLLTGEITYLIDELEEDVSFKLMTDVMKFKFRADHNLPYNKKINIPLYVISLSSIIKRKDIYHANFRLQKCFYEIENFLKKYKLFFVSI